MSSPDEYKAYVDQVLAYEESGYSAAAGGDFATAVNVWSQILADPQMLQVFEKDPNALNELAWNLAIAFIAVERVEDARALIAGYNLDSAKFEEAVAAASAPAEV